MTDPMLTRAYILVVDDNPVNVALLQDTLEDAGYTNVRGVTDPREVEGYLAEAMPDLLLLDLRMPWMDGHQLFDRLKQQFGDALAPVIVLTAENSQSVRYRALEQGAVDFLTKPFDQTEVLQRIRNQLELRLRSEAHRGRADELERLVAERTAELKALSLRDPLTGLPNRRALRIELEQRLAANASVAVYFVLIEEFDEIARAHGHEVCESVSRAAADLLSSSAVMRKGMVCAWGDREFVLLLEQDDTEADFTQRSDRLLRLLGGQLDIDGIRVDLAVRMGAAHCHDSADGTRLVQLAAAALPMGRSAMRFARHEPSITERIQRQRQLRLAMRDAVRLGQFELVYQPKLRLADGAVVGAEALLRWTHPEFGPVSPVEFIPLAESSGEIINIGGWVLDNGMAQLAEWLAMGRVDDQFTLALNVSGMQLMQADFAEQVLALHRKHGLPDDVVEIEVTESGLMEDIKRAIEQLEVLAGAGIPSAIDDFGTGYSSLSYLKSLPVSVLKIDRSFVAGINSDETDRKLAETVVAIAHTLDCVVVAEGVETQAHAETLTEMGCDIGQGYLFSKPLSVSQFEAFLQINRAG